MKLLFATVIAIHFATAHAGADQVLDLTLPKAVQMALGKNFSIKLEKFEPDLARERVRTAEGRFDPTWDLSYQRTESKQKNSFTRDTVTGEARHFEINSESKSSSWSTGVSGVTVWGLGYGVELSSDGGRAPGDSLGGNYTSGSRLNVRQPLLRGAGLNANLSGVRVARNNVLASQWGVKDRVMQVITDVIEVYNDLHFAKENYQVAIRSRGLAEQLLRDNIKRVEIGVMKAIDVTTAQAEVAARNEDVIVAARVVKDQENFLKQLLTADMLELLRTEVKIAPPPSPKYEGDVVGAIVQAMELRPDYQQAKLDLQNRDINLRFEKNQKLPRLDLTATLSVNGFDEDFTSSALRLGSRDQTDWSLGAIFSVPLGNREARGRVNAAQLEVAQALVGLQRLEQDIIVRVDNARGGIITGLQRIEATRESHRLAAESLSAGEKRLVAGTGTVFEVLELQKKLAEAETSELRAHADYNKVVARFEFETGRTLRAHGVAFD